MTVKDIGSVCRKNGFRGLCAVAAMILTIVIAVVADRLVVERNGATVAEQVRALGTGQERIMTEYARREVVEIQYRGLREEIAMLRAEQADIKAQQAKMFDVLMNLSRRVK